MSETTTGAAPGSLRRVTLVVTGAAILSALVAFLVEPQSIPHMGRGMGSPMAGPETGVFLDLRMFLSTYSGLLLVALTWNYLSMYRRLPNRFTISLVLFTTALFLYALSSNPAIHVLFGFRGGPELGPFLFVPDLFAAVAVTILLYQSYQ